jgi:hypothetical protein
MVLIGSFVKKTVNSDRIISIQVKAEPVSVLLVMYMSASVIERDGEQEL